MTTDPNWRARWVGWRNRVLANERFQKYAARLPIVGGIARRRARGLFDLLAGFTYSQIVLAVVESGMLEFLAAKPRDLAAIAVATDLSPSATERLIHAARALDLVQEVAPGWWMLGQQGAVLQANRGVQAMVRHHRLLYADLADPLGLLKRDRADPTALSTFWTYAHERDEEDASALPYSELMADSQAMVSSEACAAYDFGQHESVLDIGGGFGTFASRLATSYPQLRLGVLDLPEVVAEAGARLESTGLADRIALHPGSFFADEIPAGYDCHTLVRIVHDHDDDQVSRIFAASRRALGPGGKLVVIEPMSAIRGAESVGAHFELYLWAMGTGRPRSEKEIGALCVKAGFSRWRRVPTGQPIVASVIVAFA
jgi:demethylspheroidene O-methyltransferase